MTPMMQFVLVGDRELVAKFARVGPAVERRLSDVLFDAMRAAQRTVKVNKLSGQVLHRRSGHLSESVIASPKGYREGANLVGFFGVPEGPTAVYGFVHEYGGTFRIPAHLQRNPGGRAAGLKRPALLTGEREYIAAPEGGYHWVKAHDATYPERSYIRSTFREIRGALERDLQGAVSDGVASA